MSYYGSDSGSVVQSPNTQDFYIGKMGAHNETGSTEVNIGAGDLFNTSAIVTGTTKVYGYWWLGGPGADPNFNPATYTASDAQGWGQTQGQCAVDAANGTTSSNNGLYFSNYLTNLSIYADVETGGTAEPNYWLTPGTTYNGNTGALLNMYVLDGFLTTVNSSGWYPGVYSTTGEWSTIFGSTSYSLGYTGSVTGWTYNNGSWGGVTMAINQYNQNPDYDSASSLPS